MFQRTAWRPSTMPVMNVAFRVIGITVNPRRSASRGRPADDRLLEDGEER